jgi:hypothetical protein
MMPLLRSIPHRAIVRLLRYLRTLLLSDSAADATASAAGKDCNAVPSLQRVVEWASLCLDAVGLQVSQRLFREYVMNRFAVSFLTCLQLATTQEGREICAGLKRAAQVSSACSRQKAQRVTLWVCAGSAARGGGFGRPARCRAAGAVQPPLLRLQTATHPLPPPPPPPLQLMERAKMPTQGRPARCIDIVNL